ncbi:MAG: 50S ribosomal protein L4 [Flavobacteriales bacterium]|nr:50S ribosomal protein L4 [Flavobacteriales bacterium]|tara:strand:+ start:1994 stop:2620 length:627 start_codon:yes stop_codon:yes gene_type:complete
MELAVYNISGKKTTKKVKLNKKVFGIDPNNHAIYLDVKQYLANQRQGTHKTKERGEITGSTRKIKKQKGTGTARAGSIKNPLFRSGGRVFGPQPRNYGFKLNKKLKKLARSSALSLMAKDKNITILEDFSFDSPKTKKYLEILSNFELNGQKTLLILSEPNDNIYLSARNLNKTNITTSSNLNTYQILNAGNILMVESSIKLIENTLS